MATNVDLSGNTLYVTDVVTGSNTPNVLTSGGGSPHVRLSLIGVNFNSATTDNPITVNLPTGSTTYKVSAVAVWGASHSLTTATAGLFTAASGGGTAICADQALTPTSGTANTNLNTQDLTMAANDATTAFTSPTLFFRVGTPEGAAATGNVTVLLRTLG